MAAKTCRGPRQPLVVAPCSSSAPTTLTTDAEWGTDNFDFLLEGVPTFVANQEEGNYLINYHAMSDTFDKVDIPESEEACGRSRRALPLPLPTCRAENRARGWTRAEIEQTMHETHLDDQLKTFGMWKDWESGKRGRRAGDVDLPEERLRDCTNGRREYAVAD